MARPCLPPPVCVLTDAKRTVLAGMGDQGRHLSARKNGSDSCWKTAVISPKNIHSFPCRIIPSIGSPRFSLSLSFLPIVFLDKNAFRRAPHFRQRIFIVNRFLPSRSFQPSACLSSYGTRFAAIFIDFPRRFSFVQNSIPGWFTATRLFRLDSSIVISLYPCRAAQLHQK